MRLRPGPATPARTAAGPSSPGRPGSLRSSALAAALPVALLLSACGGGQDAQETAPEGETAAALHETQPMHVRDATLAAESSESGTYSELATVRYSEQVRAATELDKPECLDAANQWTALDGVRDAPASVAAYEWSEGAVTHMLVRLDEETAEEALSATPPRSCDAYSATHEDGTVSEYAVEELPEMPRIADSSRALAVEVDSASETSRMFSLMYRNGGLLGTTSVVGAGELRDYEQMLVEFSEAAVERQRQMLGGDPDA